MATNSYFEETVRDAGEKSATMELEFGTTTHHGDGALMFFRVDGNSVAVDKETGRRIFEAMLQLGKYLGYQKP